MSGWSIEDALAMERRHIFEGEKRVAQQEALAAGLSRKGHDQLALAADDLLGLLRETLELSRMRLRQLEGLSRTFEPAYRKESRHQR
jgi:hypothetical protein